jgi:hypothetical protein
MSRFIAIETPGGPIRAEIEETPGSAGVQLTSFGTKTLESFEETVNAFKKTLNIY